MNELERLATFINFPTIVYLYPTIIAALGFAYTGRKDEIRCTDCGTTLQNLISIDDLVSRHLESSSNCQFITNLAQIASFRTTDQSRSQLSENDVFNKLSSDSDSSRNQERRLSSSKTANLLKQDNSFLSLQPTPTVMNPISLASNKYACNRLNTYARWPKGDLIAPEKLANAGFIYTGDGDIVKCVFCNGSLRTWEANDDPMKRHEKNYPLCAFVCGRPVGNVPMEYSKLAQHKNDSITTPSHNYSDIAVDGPGHHRVLPKNSHAMDPRETKARLDTPQARKVLEMGFPMDLVRTVIDDRLKSHGDDFPSLTSFVEALYRKQQQNGR